MSNKKNNHYVPQFHLRQWSSNKKTIMAYNISKDIYIKEASIKNQASKNYLYGHNNNFEDIMGKIETYASPVYTKIILNKSIDCLNDEELDFIYLFAFMSFSCLFANSYLFFTIPSLRYYRI